MKIVKKIYKHNLLYNGHPFEYDLYKNVNDKELLSIFDKTSEILDRKLFDKKVSGKDWISWKVKLWGIWKSKPSLFKVVATGDEIIPTTFYDIIPKLK